MKIALALEDDRLAMATDVGNQFDAVFGMYKGAAAVFLLYAWWARRHPESSLRRIVLTCGYMLFQCCAAVVLAAVYMGSIVLFIVQSVL